MNMIEYMTAHRQEALELLITLAQIPAPSGQEDRRAAFCKDWLERHGAKGVYIDPAKNVVYPIGCTDDRPLVVFMAHSDVVFPDTQALPLTIGDGRIYCPGVGDDTANVVALLMAARYVTEEKLQPKDCGVLFVVDACEEGLGDLKGCRRIMADYGSRMARFYALDDKSAHGVHRAVGSRRFRVEVTTQGGHSFSNFGRPNAIGELAALITRLYQVQVPDIGRTTYNVGTVTGGTSVNTIAQSAEMLYEIRSDEAEGMELVQAQFDAALAACAKDGVTWTVTKVGDRPCGGAVDEMTQSQMMARAEAAMQRHYGHGIDFGPGSTDCNLPLSMGIPAICIGCLDGAGAHTRQEYLEIDSLYPGLCVAAELVLHHFE